MTDHRPSQREERPSRRDDRVEMTPTDEAELAVVFTADGVVLDTRCRLRFATEHLLSLMLVTPGPPPPAGTMVELEIKGRTYRSTVQKSGTADFVLLRPRDLESFCASRRS